MRTVTIDTNLTNARDLINDARAAGLNVAVLSTTTRELEDTNIQPGDVDEIIEIFVLDESGVGLAVLASDSDAENFETALYIISNGSFPTQGRRDDLSPGERRQLRDAQILASHVSAHRDVFVTDDSRGFVQHGRREQLQSRLKTQILTGAEFRSVLDRT